MLAGQACGSDLRWGHPFLSMAFFACIKVAVNYANLSFPFNATRNLLGKDAPYRQLLATQCPASHTAMSCPPWSPRGGQGLGALSWLQPGRALLCLYQRRPLRLLSCLLLLLLRKLRRLLLSFLAFLSFLTLAFLSSLNVLAQYSSQDSFGGEVRAHFSVMKSLHPRLVTSTSVSFHSPPSRPVKVVAHSHCVVYVRGVCGTADFPNFLMSALHRRA